MQDFIKIKKGVMTITYQRIRDINSDKLLWIHPDTWRFISNTQKASPMVTASFDGTYQFLCYDESGRSLNGVASQGNTRYEIDEGSEK